MSNITGRKIDTKSIIYGNIIGYLAGHPIYDFIHIEGERKNFASVALTNKKSHLDLSQLKDGDIVIPPKLLYR